MQLLHREEPLRRLRRELSAALTEKPGILAAELDIPKKTLRLEHNMDRDALEDLLDGMGLIID